MTLTITHLPCGDTQIGCDTPELLSLIEKSLPCLQELDPQTDSRLFPPPCEHENPLNQDWRAFVLPDLHALFQSQQDTVRADLRRAEPTATIRIPPHHREAWIHSLNQARLHLFALHALSEESLHKPEKIQNPEQKLAALKIHLYGLIQEALIKTHRTP